MSVFFMTILFGIGLSFIRLVPGEFYAAQRLQTDTAGYYVADAGVSRAIAWLENATITGSINQNTSWNPGTFDIVFPIAGGANPKPAGKRFFTTDATKGAPWTVDANSLQSGWNYETTVDRYLWKDMTTLNGGSFYVIASVAKKGNTSYRKVKCWVRQTSLSDYAYAVDNLPTDIWLNLGTFRLNGPYFTNGRLMLNVPDNWWPTNPADPLTSRSPNITGLVKFWRGASNANLGVHPSLGVVDGITFKSGSSGSWTEQDRMPYNVVNNLANGGGTPYNNRYEQMVQGGKNKIQQSDVPLTMPNNTANLADIAMGAAAPSPGATPLPLTGATTSVLNKTNTVNLHGAYTGGGGGTYRNANGGLFVEGDVEQITLSAPTTSNGNGDNSDGNTNSCMVITQGTGSNAKLVNVTHVYESFTLPANAKVNGSSSSIGTATTLNYSTNGYGYTVVQDQQDPTRFAVYEGTGNGAVFINGDVNGFKGTNRGRKTFATRTDSGSSTSLDKEFFINGEILRADTTPGSNPTGPRDQLGVISYKVTLKSNDGVVSNGMSPSRGTFTASNPLRLYGAFCCGRDDDPRATHGTEGGGFGTQSYSDSSQGAGQFHLFGSLAEGTRQFKGQFSSATGLGTSGFNYQYNYDQTMALVSPPFYPTATTFKIDAWNEEAAFNY